MRASVILQVHQYRDFDLEVNTSNMPPLAGGRVSFGCMHAFANLVVCEGVPLKANQARVIQLFKGVLHAELTSYLLCDQPERLPYRARRAAMAAMQDGDAWEPKYIKVDASQHKPCVNVHACTCIYAF